MAQRALVDQAAVRMIIPVEKTDMDQQLPEWARRSNPIVRRQLGAYWKTLMPDLGLIVKLVLLQVVFIAISYAIPAVFTVIMPTVTVSLVLLPCAAIIYLQSLVSIAATNAVTLVDERRKDTLPLLLMIPRPLTHILYSKVAAGMWRQIENLGIVWLAVVLFSMPLLIIQYDLLFSIETNPLLMRGALLVALASALIRLFLEPIMIGSIAVLMGAITWARVPAVVGTVLLAGAYFLAINLLRLLPLDPALRLFVDSILPLIAPLVITFGALRLATWALRRD